MTDRALIALALVAIVIVAGCSQSTAVPAGIEPRSDLDPGRGCDRQFAEAKINALFFALNAGDLAAIEKMFPSEATWHFAIQGRSNVAVSTGGGITVEPGSGFGSQLLDAVNKNDVAAVQKMFPAAGGWDFELAPPIDALLKRGRAGTTTDIRYASYSDLPNRVQLPELLRQFQGIHLTFSTPLQAKGGLIEHQAPQGTVRVLEAGAGPVLWQATGPRLREHGKSRMEGAERSRFIAKMGFSPRLGLVPRRSAKGDRPGATGRLP